ncbi:MAG TPA: hypothetical protein PK339_14535 [Flavitalea sp.]|nr:hypothetical protein [Flavitalea sp.]
MCKSAVCFFIGVKRRLCPYPVAVVFFLCLVAACGSAPEQPRQPDPNTAIPFACLRYDSAQVEYRLDSLQNRGFILQTYLPDAADRSRPYELIAYVLDTLDDYPNSWIPDTLRIVSDSLPKYFSGRVIVGNNEIRREQIEDIINDRHGNRISYDYLLFTPTVEGNFNHLVYWIKPIKGNAIAAGNEGKIQISSPQPPTHTW